jgi:hypothetical protein
VAKLEFYGIKDNFLKLVKSYLIDRYQRVKIDSNMGHYTVYSEWKRVKHGVPQGSILLSLLFLIYINDLPNMMNAISTPVLFVDDTSVIVKTTSKKDFYNKIMTTLDQLNTWFSANLLSLNLDKTHLMYFKTKNSCNIDFLINFGNYVTSRYDIKFLGLTLDNQLNWKVHTDILFSKLSTSSYMTRILKQTLSQVILLMSYFAYFHSIMSYGFIFWGNSSYGNRIFKLQKRVIRIITGVGNRDSCRELFKNVKILTLVSQYIYSLVIFIIENRDYHTCNYDIHNRNSRQGTNLHEPIVSLSLYQKGSINMGIKIFNNFLLLLRNYILYHKNLNYFLEIFFV